MVHVSHPADDVDDHRLNTRRVQSSRVSEGKSEGRERKQDSQTWCVTSMKRQHESSLGAGLTMGSECVTGGGEEQAIVEEGQGRA